MDANRPRPDEDFPDWRVEYISGSDWRITVILFIVDHTVKEPTVKFVSEEPHLQYVSIYSKLGACCVSNGTFLFMQNFEVRGKCIGQQSYGCQQFYLARSEAKSRIV